ncbi:hypothetical protein [Actinomadura sp. DC4]|uniref:hypothetical protein n=1 Tax=Actinomadura sp. DC4 TaxID=3055069 RepID=UPI0025AED8D8|nr:hypothetical protein [Actinomadura sp. DC4]MDN3354886.1 hypothetical protein [Actinomadura sp. DC4]
MPLPIRSLDDKSFDDLTAEGHAFIPRVFPAWTDHNESDPGVTLMELFAFLVESLVYQADRVTDRTLVNLARLAGVEPRAGDTPQDLLARAAARLSTPACAVTADDVVALALNGLFQVKPPPATALPAGTEAGLLTVASSGASLAEATPAGAAALTLTAGPVPRPGDLLAVGPPAGDEAFEVVTARSVDQSVVTLEEPASLAHDAGAPVAPLTSGPPGTRLAALAPAGAATVAIVPGDAWTAGVLRFTGEDGAVSYAAARPAVARVSVTAVAPAGEPDVVRVVLVPAGSGGRPVPAEPLLQQAYDLVRNGTPLTTRIRTVPPAYRPVGIAVTVVRDVATQLRKDTVQAAVENALVTFLSPLRGGAAGQGWEFGRAVYRSELYALLEDVRGVDHVVTLLLDGDESLAALPLAADPAAAAETLADLDDLTVTVLDPGAEAW